MKRIALAAAISTIVTAPAFAASYSTVFYSGTLADPSASFSIDPSSSKTWYVDSLSGSASNTAQPAIQKAVASDWTFDFTNLSAVAFTGTLEMGDFKTQSTVAVTPSSVIDGRQTYIDVKYTFSGVGSYDEATNTFTYNFLNTTVNGGGASLYIGAFPGTCQNGATSPLGKVCTSFSTTTLNWEGLALDFVFSEDRQYFQGALQGIQTSGTGPSRNTTTINWVTAVPIPSATWMFGSSLLGLAVSKRRRRS
jgi:hypothetical protein